MNTHTARRPRGRPRQSDDAQTPVQALDRGLAVLNALADHDGPTAAALVEITALPASTIHRLLTTLESHGFATQDLETGRWRIGVRAFVVGLGFAKTRKLEVLARPGMERLRDLTGETVLLACRSDDTVVVTAAVAPPALLRVCIEPGQILMPDLSAHGRALLAEDAAWAASYGPSPRLQAALQGVRSRGWALDDGESAPDARGLAAPIRDHTGRCIASVGVMGPCDRLTPSLLPRFARFVREAATTISLALGHEPEREDVGP